MDRKTYDLGLFGKERLICEGENIYYYTTYENRRISAVDLNNENLDSNQLVVYNLETEESILRQN